MKQVSITELRRMPVKEIKEALPFDITSDGEVIAELAIPAAIPPRVQTQCPNCKNIYLVTPPDNKPFFFSTRH